MRTLSGFRYLCLSLVLLVMLFAAYSNTFSSPPVLDDFHTFVDQPSVRVSNWNLGNIKLLTHTEFGLRRLIPMATFSFDFWIGHGELFFFHLTNLVIHFLCFLSILFLVYQIIDCAQRYCGTKEITTSPWEIAIWVAGIWVLHPIQTSAVTYLVQRMASLQALFHMLCVAFYLSGRSNHLETKSLNAKSMGFYISSLICFVLACLSKENAAMIPVVVLCAEGWFFQPSLFRRIPRFARKHWMICAITLLVVCFAAWHMMPSILGGYKTRSFTLGQRLLTESRVVVWYVSLLLFPDPSRFSLEHDVVVSTSLIHPVTTLFSISILLVFASSTFIYRKKYPVITFGFLWFLLNLFIESSVVPLELVFEHRMYLPSVGILLSIVVAGWSLARLCFSRAAERDFRVVTWCVVALVAAGLTLATFDRNSVWKDPVTFNRDNVAKAPLNPRAHANLASALASAGKYEEAIKEARTSIELSKKFYEQYCVAVNAIVSAYMAMGRNDEAVSEGESLLKERDKDSDAGALPAVLMNLAMAHQRQGDYAGAVNDALDALKYDRLLAGNGRSDVDEIGVVFLKTVLQEAKDKGVDLSHSDIGELVNLPIETCIAKILIDSGYREKGRELLERYIASNPHDEPSKTLLESMRKEDEADKLQSGKSDFTKKYVLNPFSQFNASMALAFLVRSNNLPLPFLKVGEVFLDYALKISPNSPDAHLLKGWYYYSKNDWKEAVREARRAIDLDPDYAKAWLGMGFFLLKAGNPAAEVIMAFQKSLELYPGSPQQSAIAGIILSLQESPPAGTGGPATSPLQGSASRIPNSGRG